MGVNQQIESFILIKKKRLFKIFDRKIYVMLFFLSFSRNLITFAFVDKLSKNN